MGRNTQDVLNQLCGRTKPEDVLLHLDVVENSLAKMTDINSDPDTLVRSIAIQSLLHIGARSHFHISLMRLNAT